MTVARAALPTGPKFDSGRFDTSKTGSRGVQKVASMMALFLTAQALAVPSAAVWVITSKAHLTFWVVLGTLAAYGPFRSLY